MHDGFILLHRKIRLNWIYKRSDYYHWFTEFIFMANFKDNNNYLFEGEFIIVKRGQFITSYRQLAKKLPNCSEQKIRTFIKLLIKDKIVLIKSLKKATQITICNYDSYQGEQHNSNTVATQQQHSSNTVATSIERKRKKENKKNNENKLLFTYEKFIILFNEITGRNFKGDSKSEGHFNQRIKKYNGAEFGIAIRNAHKDDYLQQNPKYLTPEYISRENQMEKWLNVIEGVKTNGQTRKKTVYDINPDIKNNPDRMKFK